MSMCWAEKKARPIPKYLREAFCSSEKCCKHKYKGKKKRTAQGTNGMAVKRNLPLNTIDCPDCYNALYWSLTEINGETRANS